MVRNDSLSVVLWNMEGFQIPQYLRFVGFKERSPKVTVRTLGAPRTVDTGPPFGALVDTDTGLAFAALDLPPWTIPV